MKKYLGLALWVCLCARSLSYAEPIVVPGPALGTEILYNVPMTRQSTDYSCGAGALQAVLGYYGIEYMEREVMKGAHTKPGYGTDREGLVEFAEENDISAINREGLTLEELRDSVKRGHPVIVEIQAWPDKPIANYTNVWTEGHYVVVIGLDESNVYFMDPSILGGRGVIPIPEFLVRWHEVDSKGEKAYQTGILFNGPINPPPRWQYIP